MFIDINRIGPDGFVFDEPVRIDPPEEGGEPLSVLSARLKGRAERGKRGVDLWGHLDARVRLECSRCLEPFETDISTDFHLSIVPDGAEFGSGETQVTEEEAELFYATEGKAELRVIAAEQVHLNMPLKPICGEDCAGLCPTCGANRNRIDCGCRSEEVDPRLAPLLEFKKRQGDA